MTKAFRIWLGIAAGLFVFTLAALVFFLLPLVGFVHITTLYWLCYFFGLHLLVALTLWRCRNRRWWSKILLIFSSVLCALVITFFAGGMAIHNGIYGNATSTLHIRHTISQSPEGTNRIIVYHSFHTGSIMAAPLNNPWFYRSRPPQRMRGFVHGSAVEWTSEHRALVWVVDYLDYEVLEDGINRELGYITVEFPQ
ncbi:MAG: hypothetical protein FWE40_09890 [Oscillospiraceae bacterium]|nr:hypothetical protein [Oscillospiraceae bacterium]